MYQVTIKNNRHKTSFVLSTKKDLIAFIRLTFPECCPKFYKELLRSDDLSFFNADMVSYQVTKLP